MRKSGIIITSIACAAVVAACIAGSTDSITARPFDGSARMRGGAGGSTSQSLGPVLEIGTEHIYQVSFAQSVCSDRATSPEVGVSLEGTWAVAYAGSDDRGLVFRAQLREDTRRASRRRRRERSVLGYVAHRVLLHDDGTGPVDRATLAPKLDDITRTTLSTLAATFQVSELSRGATWEATESDSLGDYRARYTRGATFTASASRTTASLAVT